MDLLLVVSSSYIEVSLPLPDWNLTPTELSIRCLSSRCFPLTFPVSFSVDPLLSFVLELLSSLNFLSFGFTSFDFTSFLDSVSLSLPLIFFSETCLSVDFVLGVSWTFLTCKGVTGAAGFWTYLPDLIARMSVLFKLITFFGVDDLFLLAGLGEGFLTVYFSTVAWGGAS